MRDVGRPFGVCRAFALVAILLAGCGGSTRTVEPLPSPTLEPTPTAPVPAVDRACELVTVAQVERITGAQVDPPQEGGNEQAGVIECAFAFEDPGSVLVLGLYQVDGPLMFEAFRDSERDGEELPGIGDRAWWARGARALYVLDGERMLYVQRIGGAAAPTELETVEDVALTALDRLDELDELDGA